MVKRTTTTTTTTTAAAAAARPADDPANFELVEEAAAAPTKATKPKNVLQPRKKLTAEEKAARVEARKAQAAENKEADAAIRRQRLERTKKREEEFNALKVRLNTSAATKIFTFFGAPRVSGAAKRMLTVAMTDYIRGMVTEQVRLVKLRGRRTIKPSDAELSVSRTEIGRTML